MKTDIAELYPVFFDNAVHSAGNGAMPFHLSHLFPTDTYCCC